jgi:hypothetical protein
MNQFHGYKVIDIRSRADPSGHDEFACVEAGSNTSTVTLRIVGGDENESVKSERLKYDRGYQGILTRERLRWQGPAACTNDRPVTIIFRVS